MEEKKKILIIEDSIFICQILEMDLRKNGFEVSVACDGKTGLKKAKKEKPDLIILDLVLPKLPGEQVCKEIKKDEQCRGIPIIMLTAKGSDTDRIIGRVIGADSYMSKPFDIHILLEEIARLIAE